MGKEPEKSISDRINECRHFPTEQQVISCLEKLLAKTKDGQVSYELAHEYEKLGRKKEAVKYYEKAESLFTQTNFKNMARAAINNIVIESLISEKDKKKGKKKASA